MMTERDDWAAHVAGETVPSKRRTEEADFRSRVIQLAVAFGWCVFCVRDSRFLVPDVGGRGFPDLVLGRWEVEWDISEILVAELKRGPQEKPTEWQERWMSAFRRHRIDAYVWRPADWDRIEERLKRRPRS